MSDNQNLVNVLGYLRKLEYTRRVAVSRIFGKRATFGIYWSRTTRVLILYHNPESKKPESNHLDVRQMFEYFEVRDRLRLRRSMRNKIKD